MARELLGKILVHDHPTRGWISGRIVETEAYRGQEDLACHASRGKTRRTATMYERPGLAYVYLIYGMYDMLNAVCWPIGHPAAVLIRAVEPLTGIERTTDGPGKLTRAFDITRAHNGHTLSEAPLFIAEPEMADTPDVETSPRVGVDYAGEWAQKPWRFSVVGSRHVSRRPGKMR